jgi:hypothetical protein
MPIHESLMQIQSDRTEPLKKAEDLATDEVRIFSQNRQILEFFAQKKGRMLSPNPIAIVTIQGPMQVKCLFFISFIVQCAS